MTDSSVPDYTEPFVGWRAWKVERGALWSLGFGVEWPGTTPLVAKCMARFVKHEESVPASCCRCGIYAVESRQELLQQTSYNLGRGVVIGEVNIWGEIMPGEIGLRGQYAFPKRIFVPHLEYKLVPGLRERYRVPVTLDNTFEVEGEDPS